MTRSSTPAWKGSTPAAAVHCVQCRGKPEGTAPFYWLITNDSPLPDFLTRFRSRHGEQTGLTQTAAVQLHSNMDRRDFLISSASTLLARATPGGHGAAGLGGLRPAKRPPIISGLPATCESPSWTCGRTRSSAAAATRPFSKGVCTKRPDQLPFLRAADRHGLHDGPSGVPSLDGNISSFFMCWSAIRCCRAYDICGCVVKGYAFNLNGPST